MVGICGVVGDPQVDPDAMTARLHHRGTEATTAFDDGYLSVRVVDHDDGGRGQPAAAAGGDVQLWAWGEIYGYEATDGYVPRTGALAETSDAAYVADRYDDFGDGFAGRVNGEFAGVRYDRAAGTVALFTDRLGVRPFYHATTSSGGRAFATAIQALAAHPGVEPAFEGRYLAEYLARRRVYGLRTPLAGVERTHPGAITHVDPDGDVTTDRYWAPRYAPRRESFPDAVERFLERFRAVFRERVDPDLTYGVLLSGGADSRLVLAMFDELGVPVTAYHMNEWPNREAQTAERVADTLDVEFRFLERDPDYQARALSRTPALADFTSTFNQAHAWGFADRLAAEVDVVVTGHYATEAVGQFGDYPVRRLDTHLGRLELPFTRPIDSVEDYVAFLGEGLPGYVEQPSSLAEVIRAEIHADDDGIVHHGVRYPSLRDAMLFTEIYPVTNDADYLNYTELVAMGGHWNPYLDRRIVEFGTTLPVAYRLRRNVVNRAIREASPALASIPYSNTGVAVGRPFPLHYLGEVLRRLRKRYCSVETPEPHYSYGPWTHHTDLIRADDFLERCLERNADRLAALPGVSADDVWDTYRRHQGSENHWDALYAITTLLEMPVTADVLATAARKS